MAERRYTDLLQREHVLCGLCHSVIEQMKSLGLLSCPRYDTKNQDTITTAVTDNARNYRTGYFNAEVDAELALTINHHRSLEDLRRSSLTGCHLCSLLWALIVWNDQSPPPAEFYVLQAYRLDGLQQCVSTLRLSTESSPDNVLREIGFFDEMLSEYILDQWPLNDQTCCWNDSTGADSCFELSLSWLRTCKASHSRCGQALVHRTFRPTRLLEVRNEAEQMLIRLRDQVQLDHSEPYLTLSHCWGKAHTLKLEKRSLVAFSKDIPFTSLPNTFRDAVIITQRLGYKYLWIDSLCIVQDSSSDWSAQAALMADIFSNADLTIAALRAQNSDVGCFAHRSPLARRPLRIATGQDNHIYAWPKRADALEWGCGPGSVDPSLSPLCQRAWVVQERALSTRILYYGSTMLFWECTECCASEDQPNMHPRSDVFEIHDFHRSLIDELADEKFEFDMELECHHDRWWQLIYHYTYAKLTYATDRWVAFSGLASRIVRRSRHRLIAGLWSEDIAKDLLWKAYRPGFPIANGAPSWSWVSMDGTVLTQTPTRGTTYHVEVLELPSHCGEELQWGAIAKQAETRKYPIKIRGRLQPIKISGLDPSRRKVGTGESKVGIIENISLDTIMHVAEDVWTILFAQE